MDERMFLKIGELARETGKTVRALHLYEELGLLKPAQRTDGGFRLYAPDARSRVEWISKLQDMGFSLNEMQTFLQDWERAQVAPEGGWGGLRHRVQEHERRRQLGHGAHGEPGRLGSFDDAADRDDRLLRTRAGLLDHDRRREDVRGRRNRRGRRCGSRGPAGHGGAAGYSRKS